MAATSTSEISTAASAGTRYLPKIYSADLKPDFSPEFEKIKRAEDALRKLYALPKDHDSRPDKDDPVHGLIELNDEDIAALQKKMKTAWYHNSKVHDPQYRMHPGAKAPLFDEAERISIVAYIMSKIDPKFHPNLCPAGGSVTQELVNPVTLSGKRKPPNDIDLFLVGLEDDELEPFVAEFLCSIGSLFWCTRTAHSITISYGCISHFDIKDKSTHPTRKEFESIMSKYDDYYSCSPPQLQIILRSYKSPSEVVTGFDLDASGLCYHMGKYYATPRAIYALENMTLTFDIDRFSTTYNVRMLKYMKEKGFMVYIPIPIAIELFSEIPKLLSILRKDINTIHQNTLIGFLAMEVLSAALKFRSWGRSDYDETDTVYSKPVDSEPVEENNNQEDESPNGDLDLLSRKEFEALPEAERSIWDPKSYNYYDAYKITRNYFTCVKVNITAYQIYHANRVYQYVNKYIYGGPRSSRRLIGYTVRGSKEHLGYLFDFPPLNLVSVPLCLPTHIEFLTSNPGTQFTGSFNPVTLTWLDWATIIL